MMNFYVNVKELMLTLLPKPKAKQIDPFQEDKAETLKELGILMEGYAAC